MTRYILGRLVQTALVLLIMSFIIYSLIGLMPGDPIDIMVNSNPNVSPEVAATLRKLYGLDQPITTRYWNWLTAAITGDLGYSRTHHQPVLDLMAPALLQTCKLLFTSFTLSVLLSFVLGITAARNPGSLRDNTISLATFAGISVPVFWLCLVMILVFAVQLHWFPASGIANVGDGSLRDHLIHLVLPVTTLALATTGGFTRFVRASMLETLRLDLVRTARAKGASENRVVIIHAFRNALIPVVTIIALSFGTLFNGALVVETMFAQPGMGKMIYDAILGNDFNLALSGLLFATLITLLCNLAADLAYGYLDPRISLR